MTDEVKVRGLARAGRKRVGPGRPASPDGPKMQQLVRAATVEERLAILEEMGSIRLTRSMIDAIEEKVREGNYPQVVARSVGVAESTFSKWMTDGEERWGKAEAAGDPALLVTSTDPAGLCVELYLRVGQVDAQLEVDTVHLLRERIDGERHWQGAMTLLERRYPKRWAKRDPQSGGDQRSIEQQIAAYMRGAHDAAQQGPSFGLPQLARGDD